MKIVRFINHESIYISMVVQLDEKLLIEEFGDATRPDVFPGKGHSAKVLTTHSRRYFYFVDNEGETIILFKFNKKNEATSIYIPKPLPEVLELISELEPVDQELSNYLTFILTKSPRQGEVGEIQIDGETKLIFKPHPNVLNRVLEYEMKERDRALETLLSYELDTLPISEKLVYNGDLSKVVTIIQGEYAIINSKSEKNVVGTFGLGDCIGLVLYDTDNQVAAVAHIDGFTDIHPSISKLLYDLSEAGGESYEARLFGGSKNTAKKLVELIEELRKNEIEIVEADILEQAKSRDIGISTDGILYNKLPITTDTIKERMMLAGTKGPSPLHCHYKPPKTT